MSDTARDERRWLLGRQTSGLNVVMAPDDRFNGVNPKETVWVVSERRLLETEEALRELQEVLGIIAYPDPMTTRRELVTYARDALGPDGLR